ncbi:prolyl-tRNA editing protein ProX [Clostridiales bacterium]|nr:prolyl-tRNA editing protein ProX [Clostridiales bacterium]
MEEREKRVYNFLDKLGIKYDRYTHEPMMTIADAVEVERKMGLEICKNLFLRSKTDYYLLLMEGSKKFNTGRVSKQLGIPRMTFGAADAMEELLDLYPGSVSPLGLINDEENKVRLLVDEDVLKTEKIAVHPCMNTATLVINTEDLIEKILPACKHGLTKVVLE